MKKLSYLLIIMSVFISGLFVSCSDVKDALETTIEDVTFDVDVNVSEITTKDDSYEFGGSATLDPKGNSDIGPYLSTIRAVKIKEVIVEVTSITPATGIDLMDATFTLTDLENSAAFTYQITESTPLTLGKTFVLNSSTPNFSVVSDIISDLHSSTVSLSGHVNQTGFVLGFKYTIVADITVGVP